jgi:hypothetical protein
MKVVSAIHAWTVIVEDAEGVRRVYRRRVKKHWERLTTEGWEQVERDRELEDKFHEHRQKA